MENLGAWACTGMQVYSHARERWLRVAADHGGPYNGTSEFTVPSYVLPWLKNVRPEAIRERTAVDAETEYRAVVIHENVTLRRVDPKAYAAARDHLYIPPQPALRFYATR